MSEPPAAQAAQATRRGGATKPNRAGRNLPVAIAVAVVMAAVVLASLFVRKEAFVGVVVVAVCMALWELIQALAQRGITVPTVPVVVGSVVMLIASYVAGPQALAVCFVLTAVGVVLWRASEGAEGALPDVTGGVFAAAYLPLLASFAILMLAHDDGPRRVVVFVLVTTASDIGGYAVGVLFGRHPMSPSVSPKKSWEGFAGSLAACVAVGAVAVAALLSGPWWAGALLGLAVVLVATLGDLGESMVKRDLGIKDMGAVLPGHGGVLDRLDSLLLAAPVCWLLLMLV